MTDNSNIIELKDVNINSIITIIKKKSDSCFHQFIIDSEERIISCSACPKKFDPIEALLIIAREWSIYDMNRQRIKKEINEKALYLESLKKQIINSKATLSRSLMNEIKKGIS